MKTPKKALGESLGWEVNSASEVYACPWFSVQQFEVTRNRQRGTYTYVEHPGSVLVAPITRSGTFVLIRAYRFTTDSWSWEVPAGTLADRAGIDAREVALQELREELGATCDDMVSLGSFGLTNGSANHAAHFFLAQNVQIVTAPHFDHLEQIGEAREFSRQEVLESIANGGMLDGDSALALLLALVWLERNPR